MFADTHSHLTWKSFDHDRNEVIQRAQEAGIGVIIDSGIDRASNMQTLEISSAHSNVHSTLGFQPSHVPKLTTGQLDSEIGFIESNLDRAVALGEVGMDYHWVKDDVGRRQQGEFFERCCELARTRGVPIVVHSRECESDCMDVLEKSGITDVVMHCFSGDSDELKRAVENGYYVSIPSSVCHISRHKQNSGAVPDHLLLLETDSPFQSPRRGERNEPAYIVEAYRTVAGIKGCDVEELGAQVMENIRELFNLNKL